MQAMMSWVSFGPADFEDGLDVQKRKNIKNKIKIAHDFALLETSSSKVALARHIQLREFIRIE